MRTLVAAFLVSAMGPAVAAEPGGDPFGPLGEAYAAEARPVLVRFCVDCHATAGQPGIAADSAETRVAELGIACEACHGPAGTHAEKNRSPLHRYAMHCQREGDPTVVNPARLDARAQVDVC